MGNNVLFIIGLIMGICLGLGDMEYAALLYAVVLNVNLAWIPLLHKWKERIDLTATTFTGFDYDSTMMILASLGNSDKGEIK